ncbi:unnamed protein product [Bursaphelenchus xylophilus]|uniref:(pine wood nematode) hypothetical protein n=1 Tax=Bursaphelenchus xylophilus TaxID=6326 RepID=A0A1I7S2W2_BURXY|nr:unnamed protein product [Bursaphelenchus xylophilus]CAG9116005.1 unnamed protein product [Bursaphelenchus xylophilus]
MDDDDIYQLASQYPLHLLNYDSDDIYADEYSPDRSPSPSFRMAIAAVSRRGARGRGQFARRGARGRSSTGGATNATPASTSTRGLRAARGRRSATGRGATIATQPVVLPPVVPEQAVGIPSGSDDIVSMQANLDANPGSSSGIPMKRIKLDSPKKGLNATFQDSEQDSGCTICYEDYDSDQHRLVCLKCGHIFGKSCIIRWIQSERNGNCPTCKTKNTLKDIRPIFAHIFKGGNGPELNQIRGKLKEVLEQNEALQVKLKTTEEELEKALKTISTYNELNTVNAKEFKLTVKKLPFNSMLAKEDYVRVVCALDNEEFVVCGCQLVAKTGKSCGIAKIDSTSMKKIPLHDKIVRAIHVNPFSTNTVASTSDDDTLCVSDISLPANQLRFQYKLPSHGWACCWTSVHQIAVGLKSGRVLSYAPGRDPEDLTNGEGDKPVMSLTFDPNHRVLFICASNSVRAYRNGQLYTLLDNISIASFCYDPVTNCFLLTVPPIQGKVRTVLQIYKVDFQCLGIVRQVGNFQTASSKLSKNTVNIIWAEPGGQLLCAFFDEDRHFTSILNWGIPEERKLEDQPGFLVTIKHKPTDHIVHYAQAQKQAPPSPTAPCGVQNTLYMVTTTNMFCYCLIYS